MELSQLNTEQIRTLRTGRAKVMEVIIEGSNGVRPVVVTAALLVETRQR